MEPLKKIKPRGIKRFIRSFNYSFQGLKYAYTNEQSLFLHILSTIFVCAISIFFKITGIEWIIILLLIGLVVSFELINTSIEAAIDLCSPEIHPLAKISKDTASAATGFIAFIAFIIGLIIFLPKVIALFS